MTELGTYGFISTLYTYIGYRLALIDDHELSWGWVQETWFLSTWLIVCTWIHSNWWLGSKSQYQAIANGSFQFLKAQKLAWCQIHSTLLLSPRSEIQCDAIWTPYLDRRSVKEFLGHVLKWPKLISILPIFMMNSLPPKSSTRSHLRKASCLEIQNVIISLKSTYKQMSLNLVLWVQILMAPF